MKKNGITLIEVLVVMAILAILAVMMTMIINPIALVDKGNDARRKKDLNRIKVAFEEYNNDKGCYPGKSQNLIYKLNDTSNCGTNIFSPWLKSWPCDPDGKPYKIIGETTPSQEYSDCSKTFRVLTNLKNESDKDIPYGWYDFRQLHVVNGLEYKQSYGRKEVNYGVSSGNISWYDRGVAGECAGTCSVKDTNTGGCNTANGNPVSCEGDNCYIDDNCIEKCRVACCFGGDPCVAD